MESPCLWAFSPSPKCQCEWMVETVETGPCLEPCRSSSMFMEVLMCLGAGDAFSIILQGRCGYVHCHCLPSIIPMICVLETHQLNLAPEVLITVKTHCRELEQLLRPVRSSRSSKRTSLERSIRGSNKSSVHSRRSRPKNDENHGARSSTTNAWPMSL